MIWQSDLIPHLNKMEVYKLKESLLELIRQPGLLQRQEQYWLEVLGLLLRRSMLLS